MWKDGGVRGLFKGNLATILKVAPQTAIQFAVSSYSTALVPSHSSQIQPIMTKHRITLISVLVMIVQ